jgi:hypothetical protein
MRPERHPQPLEVIGGVQRGDFPLPGFQGCPLIPENTPRAGGWEEHAHVSPPASFAARWEPVAGAWLRARQRLGATLATRAHPARKPCD